MTDITVRARWRGPLATLLAAGVVGAGLLAADALTDPGVAPAAAALPAPSSTTTTATSTATTPAPATATATTSTTATSTASSATSTYAQHPPAPSRTTTSAPAFPDEAIYVGRTDAKVSIAVAVRHGSAAAYICDGRSVESWLTGTVAGESAQLAGGRDTLTVRRTAAGVEVTGRIHGKDLTASLSAGSAPAGLFRLTAGTGTTIGWIVQPDGTQVGLLSRASATEPAPPLTPGQPITVDGQSTTPKEVQGDERF